MADSLLRIAITPGAENGIGPEVLIKALMEFKGQESPRFLWCGDGISLERACAAARVAIQIPGNLTGILENGLPLVFFPDLAANGAWERQARFLDLSVALAQAQKIDAIVTGPIEKAALAHVADGPFHGQTEFFAKHLGTADNTFMAFMGGPFMLSLLTTHLPLRQVADAVTEEMLLGHITSVAKHYARVHKKNLHDVRITLLGLNPHAGEDGLLGYEEQTVFAQAIRRAKSMGLLIHGPVAADGFFAYFDYLDSKPDVVIAAYHDQGLAPYKLLAHGCAVNVTFGLRVVRTSPAHGTAPYLFGKGLASSLSTLQAIHVAMNLVRASHHASI